MRTHCADAVKKQQQHDYKLKLVAVNKNFREPPEMFILSIEEEEEDYVIIIPSGHGFGFRVASCHELLLTSVSYNVLAIWNPSSKDDDEVIKTLPQSYVPRPPFVVGEADHFYGFGFDPRAPNDYKVVRFVSFDYVDGRDSYMEDWVVDLYSSTTRSWKTIQYPHPPCTISIRSSSIYINGFVYWPASCRGLFVIVPFDFANDTFLSDFIPGPTFPSARDDCFSFLVVEFEGSLGVIKYFDPDDKTIEFELWVWSDKNHNNNSNDGSWSRRGEWVIRIPGDQIDETRTNCCFLLGLFKNDQLYFEDSDGELLVFDCAKQKLKNLGVYANEYVLSLFPYVERGLPIN